MTNRQAKKAQMLCEFMEKSYSWKWGFLCFALNLRICWLRFFCKRNPIKIQHESGFCILKDLLLNSTSKAAESRKNKQVRQPASKKWLSQIRRQNAFDWKGPQEINKAWIVFIDPLQLFPINLCYHSPFIHPTMPPILPTSSLSIYIYGFVCIYFQRDLPTTTCSPPSFGFQQKKQQHVIYVKALH